MFDTNDLGAQRAWASATPHTQLTGTRTRESFSYSYKLEVRRVGRGFIGRRTGTVVDQRDANSAPNRPARSHSEPFKLAEWYAFMTPQQLDSWIREHNARPA